MSRLTTYYFNERTQLQEYTTLGSSPYTLLFTLQHYARPFPWMIDRKKQRIVSVFLWQAFISCLPVERVRYRSRDQTAVNRTLSSFVILQSKYLQDGRVNKGVKTLTNRDIVVNSQENVLYLIMFGLNCKLSLFLCLFCGWQWSGL